ncbi:MAG TPA: translation initiation factor IF-2 [Candidatus Dojkabacteria bacterium]|nr:translation initiation factor IF-2 [Candidatus Dojkabacteria bacterium]
MENKNISRTPVVAILGHVDHGKTTILDNIRSAHVQEKEVGGITQKISVFTIPVAGKQITFIDTPGHEAFDLMRLRGGSVADIVLLIVAADDGLQPQTLESIEIIKNSSAKPIVVINKIDLPDVDIEKIKRDLANRGILVEGMGGQVPVALVSGKTGQGIHDLLDMILLVSEVEGMQFREDLKDGLLGKAIALETVKDKSKGIITTLVLQQGEMKPGDWIGFRVDKEIGVEKVKGIISEENQNIPMLTAGTGGRVLGLSSPINPGDSVYVMTERSPKVLDGIWKLEEEEQSEGISAADLSALFANAETKVKSLNVIIKSSSEGSLEAIKKSIDKIKDDEAKIEIVDSGIGDITPSDIERASVTKSIILGFEVSMESAASKLSRDRKVLVRTYDIIYKLVEELGDAFNLLTMPQETEEEIGHAEVRALFTLSDGALVIGCRVKDGIIKRGCKVYVVRGDEIKGEGRIASLRQQKDTINEAKKEQECGVILDAKIDVAEGDTLYCYKIIK